MSAAEARDGARSRARSRPSTCCTPTRCASCRSGERWDEALGAASFVVAHEQFLGESAERHADVVFPAESYAEKEGTVTHPDGRLQRLRPAVGHPGEVRAEWQVLVELGERLGLELDRPRERRRGASPRSPSARRSTAASRSTRSAAAAFAGRSARPRAPPRRERARRRSRSASPAEPPHGARAGDGRAPARDQRRDLWASWETDHAPSLAFLRPQQELRAEPGRRRAPRPRPRATVVRVSSNGSAVEADGRVRARASSRAPATSPRAPPSRTRTRSPNGAPRSSRYEPSRQAVGRTAAVSLPARRHQLRRVDRRADRQVARDLRVRARDRADDPAARAQAARAASRTATGPNRVGPYGLLQPLADVLKLLGKEQFYPRTGVPFLMALAPAIMIVTAIASLAIIPFGDVKHGLGAKYGLYGIDVNIGILYAFAFGSLAFYGLLLGGWASGSKYSFLGAMRSAAQLISYEVSLGLSLIGVVMMAGSLSLVDIVEAQARRLVRRCRSSSAS